MFLEFLKFKIGINSLYYEKCSNNRGNVGLTLKRFGIKLGFVVGELLYLSDLKKQYIWNLNRIIFWDQKKFYWKLLLFVSSWRRHYSVKFLLMGKKNFRMNCIAHIFSVKYITSKISGVWRSWYLTLLLEILRKKIVNNKEDISVYLL